MLTCKNCNRKLRQLTSGEYVHEVTENVYCPGLGPLRLADPNVNTTEKETTMPEPTITDEQRAAYQRIQRDGAPEHRTDAGSSLIDMDDLDLILPLLPEELTRAPLPKEPGLYLDKVGDVWRVWDDPKDGMDRLADNMRGSGNPDAWKFAPFRKLVEETEPVTFTKDELVRIVNDRPAGRGWGALVDYINTKVRGDA
jgi:hypothetical protein